MTITLPGQQKIIVWDEAKPKKTLPLEEAVKWHGLIHEDADPPTVEVRKRCSLPPYTEIRIEVVLGDQNQVSIHANKVVTFSLMEASDFSICMIEAVRMLKATEAHAKGERYGPDSNGSVRYE